MKREISTKTWLVLILLLAVAVRMGAAVYFGNWVRPLPGTYDQVSYHTLALSILDGKGYSFPEDWYPFTGAGEPTAHWSFLYPLYLVGIYSLFGVEPVIARLVQAAACGVLTSLLVFAIARKLRGERVGLIAAGISAVYAYLIYYNAMLMTESFFAVTTLLGAYLTMEIKDRPTTWRWAALGLTMGAATLLRQTALFLAPLFAAYLIAEHWLAKPRTRFAWHQPVLMFGVMAAMIAPFTLRNYQVFDQFVLLNTNSGYALYISTTPEFGEYLDTLGELPASPPELDLTGMNEAQADKAFSAYAKQNVLSYPLENLSLLPRKFIEYFQFWPTPDSGLVSNLARTLSFGIALPFILWGLVSSLRDWRRQIPLYLFVLTFAGLHILSWPSPRYRIPSDAVFLVFAGMAVYEIGRLFLRRTVQPTAAAGARPRS